MATRPIVLLDDPRIRAENLLVTQFDEALQALVQDMWDTLYSIENAIGLAANQIGVNYRITVIDINRDRSKRFCLINPKMISRGDEETLEEEGCLSIPGPQDSVRRALKVNVQAQDVHGNVFTMDAEGLLARCIQHEMDHLEGKVFIDHLSSLKKQRAQKKFEKYRKRVLEASQAKEG